MNEIIIRGKKLGSKKPSICIPITANNQNDLKKQLDMVIASPPDLLEIRIDFWDEFLMEEMDENLKHIRLKVNETPIIATYRTLEEGGKGTFNQEELYALYSNFVRHPIIDVVDIEISQGKDIILKVLGENKQYNKKILLSYHNFNETPSEENMMHTLVEAVLLGGDLVKIAVMPQNNGDVLRLLETVYKAYTRLNVPVIAISMGQLGKITRIFGGLFGSGITFSCLEGLSSAPGQIDIKKMKKYIQEMYEE
ncbi:MAG: type I 3-dehydroquinate dehydratase [Eubacteriales bacterium]